MPRIRRVILFIVFAVITILMIYGTTHSNSTDAETLRNAHRCIGLAVAGLFFVWMPIFIYHRWKGKDIKNYMLNEENIMKMKEYNDSKDS